MAQKQSMRGNLALKEYEIKKTPDGKQNTFSIRFVKKNGELAFIPRALATGLPFNGKDNRMRGVLPVDSEIMLLVMSLRYISMESLSGTEKKSNYNGRYPFQ